LKKLVFATTSSSDALGQEEPVRISGWNLSC